MFCPPAGGISTFVVTPFPTISNFLPQNNTCILYIYLYFKIGERAFRETINEINLIFEEAESYECRTYGEGCLACLTGYTIHFCFKTHYQRVSVENGREREGRGERTYLRYNPPPLVLLI